MDVSELRAAVRSFESVARLRSRSDDRGVLRHGTGARATGVRGGDASSGHDRSGPCRRRGSRDLPQEPAQVRRASTQATVGGGVVPAEPPGAASDDHPKGHRVQRQVLAHGERLRACRPRRSAVRPSHRSLRTGLAMSCARGSPRPPSAHRSLRLDECPTIRRWPLESHVVQFVESSRALASHAVWASVRQDSQRH